MPSTNNNYYGNRRSGQKKVGVRSPKPTITKVKPINDDNNNDIELGRKHFANTTTDTTSGKNPTKDNNNQ